MYICVYVYYWYMWYKVINNPGVQHLSHLLFSLWCEAMSHMSNCITWIKYWEDSFTCISPVLHVIKMKSLSHLLLRKKKNLPWYTTWCLTRPRDLYQLQYCFSEQILGWRVGRVWWLLLWLGRGLSTESWTMLFGSLLLPIVACLSLKTILS